jgi:hypothetical protein
MKRVYDEMNEYCRFVLVVYGHIKTALFTKTSANTIRYDGHNISFVFLSFPRRICCSLLVLKREIGSLITEKLTEAFYKRERICFTAGLQY